MLFVSSIIAESSPPCDPVAVGIPPLGVDHARLVGEAVEPERVRESLRRVDGDDDRAPAAPRALDRDASRPWWSCRRRREPQHTDDATVVDDVGERVHLAHSAFDSLR